MKVENMMSSKGNKISNQFIITDKNKVTFQSYDSVIATYYNPTNNESNHELELNGSMWDYSNTTRKYFKEFINTYTSLKYESKKQWQREIKNNPKIMRID